MVSECVCVCFFLLILAYILSLRWLSVWISSTFFCCYFPISFTHLNGLFVQFGMHFCLWFRVFFFRLQHVLVRHNIAESLLLYCYIAAAILSFRMLFLFFLFFFFALSFSFAPSLFVGAFLSFGICSIKVVWHTAFWLWYASPTLHAYIQPMHKYSEVLVF